MEQLTGVVSGRQSGKAVVVVAMPTCKTDKVIIARTGKHLWAADRNLLHKSRSTDDRSFLLEAEADFANGCSLLSVPFVHFVPYLPHSHHQPDNEFF